MRILYVFPHPDDESFGPARAIAAQTRAGHDVALLTLTRGGATRERHKLGLSVQKMGEVRAKEMEQVAQILKLSDLTVLDFPDSGLKEMDPRVLEEAILRHIRTVSPDILVTYPVHGISGFHDHLVAHAVVKRAYTQLAESGGSPVRRLAFVTLTEEQARTASKRHSLSGSSSEEIDCLMTVTQEDMQTFRDALDAYVTYRDMIRETGIKESMDNTVAFEFFRESFDPPVGALNAGL
jgi:LmbE family N-acetylglucosaminyl deacetylase